jgi:hypothetical protein
MVSHPSGASPYSVTRKNLAWYQRSWWMLTLPRRPTTITVP